MFAAARNGREGPRGTFPVAERAPARESPGPREGGHRRGGSPARSAGDGPGAHGRGGVARRRPRSDEGIQPRRRRTVASRTRRRRHGGRPPSPRRPRGRASRSGHRLARAGRKGDPRTGRSRDPRSPPRSAAAGDGSGPRHGGAAAGVGAPRGGHHVRRPPREHRRHGRRASTDAAHRRIDRGAGPRTPRQTARGVGLLTRDRGGDRRRRGRGPASHPRPRGRDGVAGRPMGRREHGPRNLGRRTRVTARALDGRAGFGPRRRARGGDLSRRPGLPRRASGGPAIRSRPSRPVGARVG